MTWYTDYRQEWIAEALRVFGYINRYHLELKFGISTIQASNDLRQFQQRNPGRIVYDTSEKRYVPADNSYRKNDSNDK